MPYRSAFCCSCFGNPRTRTASTIALSALSRPSRATSNAIVTKSEGCTECSCSHSREDTLSKYSQPTLTRLISRHRVGPAQGSAPGSAMSIDDEFFFISVAARMLGMHPQTLRKYERLGLIQPSRTIGSMRLYSREELERLKLIKRLVDDGGINLAGVQRLLSVAEVMQRLRPLLRDEALAARDTRRRIAQELEELARMLGFDQ